MLDVSLSTCVLVHFRETWMIDVPFYQDSGILMKHSEIVLMACVSILLVLPSCSTSRSTQDCVMFCEVASACEFTTQPQKDSCFELCDSVEDNVTRLTGEMSVSKYFTCGESVTCDEFFQCKKNVDNAYDFLFEDGDADYESEGTEDTESEIEVEQ